MNLTKQALREGVQVAEVEAGISVREAEIRPRVMV
jgi:hypothetical protein